MAYSFDHLFAADPANPATVARAASITIHEVGDETRTPVTLKTLDGQVYPNPVTTNANGFAAIPVHESIDRLAWSGGGFTGTMTSYEGMKEEAVAARAAAESAAATAGADAAAVADAAIGIATDASEAAAASAATAASNASASATAAANSAALVGAPADTAIAAAINGSATATKTALNTAYAGKAKDVHGGQFPKPLRAPTLTVDKAWPDRNVDYRILWVENSGATLYAIGYDHAIRKSTDGGATWAKMGTQAFGVADSGVFLKVGTSTLLTMRPGAPSIIMRSTNDGATWASVFTGRSSTTAMGSQSWAVDPVTGYLYYGEYTTADTDILINVYRSTDEGATWAIFHSFPGFASASADKIRHIHSIQWDHVAGRIVVMTGDTGPAAGMYRVNADGTTLEPMILNRDLSMPGTPQAARAISILPFTDYICWTGDSTDNPYLMRMHRNQIGLANPVAERVYRLNSSGWFACRASDDGTRWVVTSSQESSTTRLDRAAHVYSVEDQGATVYEVGALSIGDNSGALSTLSPVGRPEIHGDAFFLQGHSTGTRKPVWKMRLALGVSDIPWPQERPTVYGWQTVNSGPVSVAAAATVVFAHIKAPQTALKLKVFESGAAAQSGDAASARVLVRVKGGATLYTNVTTSDRTSATARLESGGPVATVDVTAGQDLEVCIASGGPSLAYDGTATFTYGFGY